VVRGGEKGVLTKLKEGKGHSLRGKGGGKKQEKPRRSIRCLVAPEAGANKGGMPHRKILKTRR